MRVTIDIAPKELDDLIITAVEGGYTSRWAKLESYKPSAGTVVVRERGDGEVNGRPIKVTRETMRRGLQRAARAEQREGGWALNAWLRDRIGDAIIGDVILQFGVLGQVKYG